MDNLQSCNKIYNVLASLIYVLSDISPIISIADIQIASLVDIWDLQIQISFSVSKWQKERKGIENSTKYLLKIL
jgi:hypothetical protein